MKNQKRGIFTRRMLYGVALISFGILLYMGLSNLAAVAKALGSFLAIFTPFVAGMCITYLLGMPVRFFENRLLGRFKKKRALAILVTYLLAILVMALLVGLVVPQLVESIRTLLGNLGGYMNNLNNLVGSVGRQLDIAPETIEGFLLSYSDLLGHVSAWVREALPHLLDAGVRIGSGIIGALTAIIASIYMLFSKEKLLRQTRRVLYAVFPRRPVDHALRVGRMANKTFSGFISGKLLDSAIIGIICFVFMSVMNILSNLIGVESIAMPYAPLISVIVGVTNIIPFFGPFIGAIPSVMILLMIDFWSAVWFTVFIIVLQQFDGNILGPKILGESTGLPAMWVLIAIIVGGGLFGFMGMLLGVPTTAVLYTLASDYVAGKLKNKGMDGEPDLRPPPDGG